MSSPSTLDNKPQASLYTQVVLTAGEVMLGSFVGAHRHGWALRNNKPNVYGAPPEKAWQMHIEGACGEIAVAKHTGRYWNGTIGMLNTADVGKKVQVRTTANRQGRLILHDRKDSDDDAFVLVIGVAPRYFLIGWVYGRDGKLKKYWEDPTGDGRPAYFVPRDILRPMAELP